MSQLTPTTRESALLVSSALFRAFWIGFGMLLLAGLPTLFMTDAVYAIQNSVITIPRGEYNALIFAWLGHLKLAVIVLFLVPALSLRWAVSSAK